MTIRQHGSETIPYATPRAKEVAGAVSKEREKVAMVRGVAQLSKLARISGMLMAFCRIPHVCRSRPGRDRVEGVRHGPIPAEIGRHRSGLGQPLL